METPTPKQEFDRLCRVVERGMAAWVEVGIALARLRDEKMYASTHETFELFVRERFDLSRRRAYQLINESAVARDYGLDTGSQARALATVDPSDREMVLLKARDENGKCTGKSITQAASNGETEAWTLVAISERIAACAEDLRALQGKSVVAWLPLERVVTVLSRAGAMIDAAVPDARCTRCEGRGCIDCHNTGWLPSRLNAIEEGA